MSSLLWPLTGLVIVAGICLLFAPVMLNRRSPLTLKARTLDQIKTRLEIDDTRFGWLRTLGTALLTAGIAIGGWAMQQQASNDDLRSRAALADRDRFTQYVAELGDDASPTKRIDAVEYLTQQFPLPTLTDAERDEIIDTIGYRMSVEGDRTVSSILLDHFGQLALKGGDVKRLIEAAVAANRRAAFTFAVDLGTAVGRKFAQGTGKGRVEGSDDYVPDISQYFDKYVPFAFELTMGFGRHEHVEKSYPNEQQNPQELYFQSQYQASSSGFQQMGSDDALRSLLSASDKVLATSNLTVNLLRIAAENHRTAGLDLRGTMIPTDDLSNLDLAGIDWSNAILSANLCGAHLDFSILKKTNLTFARIEACQHATTIRASELSEAELSRDAHSMILQGSDVVGAELVDTESHRDLGNYFGMSASAMQQRRQQMRTAEHAQCAALAAANHETCPWNP